MRRRGAWGIWFASLAFLLSACGDAAGRGGSQSAARPRTVKLLTVGLEPLPRTIPVTGTLAAQEDLVLGMQVGGRLESLSVDVGDVVEPGAVIAELDRRDFELGRARAEAALIATRARLGLREGEELADFDVEASASVREAKAVLAEARLQRERVLELVREHLRPDADLETADAALGVAESRLQRAREEAFTWIAEASQREVELAQAQKQFVDARLLAPWRGRVAERHVAAGQFVTAGTPIVTVLRTQPLRLQLRVPERAAADVAIGQQVHFTVDGLDQPRTGAVSRLGAVVDRQNRTRLVEAAIANEDGALLPGGFCRAEIVVAPDARALIVPKSAVVTFAGVSRVFTAEPAEGGGPQRAHGHIVELGRDLGDRWVIAAGLQEGAAIVDAPGDLREGDAVVVGG
jgi:RND family efflux transporter MFP subunit